MITCDTTTARRRCGSGPSHSRRDWVTNAQKVRRGKMWDRSPRTTWDRAGKKSFEDPLRSSLRLLLEHRRRGDESTTIVEACGCVVAAHHLLCTRSPAQVLVEVRYEPGNESTRSRAGSRAPRGGSMNFRADRLDDLDFTAALGPARRTPAAASMRRHRLFRSGRASSTGSAGRLGPTW